MKIAFFTECFHPTRNGVVVSVETFSRELTALGHEVHVFAPQFPSYRDQALNIHRFRSVIYPPVPDYPLMIPFSGRMFQRFAQGRFELIHMHSPWLVARAALFLARRHRLPLVFTYHTTFDQYLHYIPLSPVFVRPLAWAVLRRTVRACDRVLAPSPEVAAALTRGGLAGTTVHTLPTGINVAQVAAGCRARGREWLRLGSEAEVLMYVGRIAPEKNLEFLVRALAPLLRARPQAQLVLVGGGPNLATLGGQVTDLGLERRVHFVGSVPHADVPHFLAAGDLFVFASLTETQGIVVAEALAAGLPVVALEANGVRSAVTHAREGFLSRPQDETTFCDHATRLLDDAHLRDRMSAAARIRAGEFSARRFARDLLGHYEAVLRARRPAPAC